MSGFRNFLNQKHIKELTDPRNLGLYIFCVVILAIAWSGAKTLQNNYELQKKISVLKQENSVTQLQNENAQLQNKYYQTDEYLDLAARQDLGLAAPGEKVMLIPKAVALKYVDQSLTVNQSKPAPSQSKIVRNFEAWRDFLLGRRPQGD